MNTRTSSGPRALLRGAVLALAVLVTGCAIGPDRRDPLENFNRQVLALNDGVDAVVLKPVATAYRDVVPQLVRRGVSNFFANLGDGWSAINSLLQFKFQHAAENWMRLNVNTFLGLGGLLDIATEMNIERHTEDFGQTLGVWGVPAGPYLMLPLLGPSTLRDTAALPIDRSANPVQYVDPAATRTSLYVLNAVDTRSNLLRASALLDGAALDKYSFIRDAHLQRRRAEVVDFGARGADNGGEVPQSGDPDPSAPGPAPAAAPASSSPSAPVTVPAPQQ